LLTIPQPTWVNRTERYSFSFITGALFAAESAALVPLLARGQTWAEIEVAASRDNLLKSRTVASRTRLLREIKYRLGTLSAAEIKFLASAAKPDQRTMFFLGICRHYAFVRQFVLTVLRPKVLALDAQLMPSDFTGFMHEEAAEHDEIGALTDKSVAKIQQVLLRMLAEASLLDSSRSRVLTSVVPSQALARLVAKTDAKQLRWLLLADSEIRHLTN